MLSGFRREWAVDNTTQDAYMRYKERERERDK